MKKTSFILVALLLATVQSFASSANNQIFAVDNTDGKITAKTIEEAFNKSGMTVDVNNNMNSIFEKRYKKTHHKSYNLAIFSNNELVTKLLKEYPGIGRITPLSMSIYSDDKKNTINVSTLSLKGMARASGIPETNADLIAYAKMLDKALHAALPKGKYLEKANTAAAPKNVLTTFTTEFELEDGETYVDMKDGLKEEFESEIGSVGFLIPKSYDIATEDYDFYDTYSIIRFNVIFPLSKEHPDAGSYAPFSLAIYKKEGDDAVNIEFPSISNWATDLAVSDTEALAEVKKTQSMIQGILEELTE
ncbi:MAG: Unknown protein [uncultured Sulfurovum sp.]|uniref:DUF302 domain-containing protein n=1 Tax=uncultured Sulfurovum sp. TaxID=269237 RepID=A0A6S6TRI5_9BACT|nr:MAG: Unknown protein [uncultured Sulfurovum sp.]